MIKIRDYILESINNISDSLSRKYGISIWVSNPRDGRIDLERIQVPEDKRNQGRAKRALEDLVRYADSNRYIITTTPSSDWGSSKSRLVNFYKSYGFVMNSGRHKDYEITNTMYRMPN